MFSLYTFKTFFNLPLAFEARLGWATPWILTRKLQCFRESSFFFGDSYSKKSSSDANSSCELSVVIIFMFSFSGDLANFPYFVTHCLHNFEPGHTSLKPFSFSILAISKFITVWALLLWQWDFKMLQHLSGFLSNNFPKNCSWWKQIVNTLSFSSSNLVLQSKIHCKSS